MSGPHARLFEQTANVTVADTVTETTLVGAGVGSATLPAGTLAAGTAIRVSAKGLYGTTGAPTLRWRVKLGGTTILDTTANNAPAAISAKLWELDAVIVCRTAGAPGTALGNGVIFYHTTHTAGQPDDFAPNSATSNVTTTGSLAFDLTVEWGTQSASNTVTCTNLSVWADQPI